MFLRSSVTIFCYFPALVWCYDLFEGFLPGAPCFTPRRIAGCSGQSLLQAHTPRSPAVHINPPETMIFLFTPSSSIEPEFLHECGGRLPRNTNFNPWVDTEVFVHGWLDGTCRTAWMREMRDQLFVRGNFNVIFVDWTWGNAPDYYSAANNTRVVGEQIAFVIGNIMDQTGTSADRFHLIGTSFGSQIVGFAGKLITKPKKLRRITGLDPALSPFKYQGEEGRLARTDAQIVDVIHTNAGDCSMHNIGDSRTMGHADFFPNGGVIQRSCLHYAMQSFLKLDIFYALASLYPPLCYHMHATQYYKVSINPGKCQFVGVECGNYELFQEGRCNQCRKDSANCAVMGMDFEMYYSPDQQNRTRKYYFNTGLECPYCDNSKVKLNGFPPVKRMAAPRPNAE